MATQQTYENREAWLAARKSAVGASDSPAILGLSTFRSEFSVYTDKTTNAIDSTTDETAEWGLRLEQPLADKFEEVTKMVVSDPGQFTIFKSSERPHLSCTPDRFIGSDAILELKTAHFASGKGWAKGIPLGYQVQMQHSLYVTGRSRGYFAVLIDGYQFKWHPISRHDKFIAKMLPRLDAFWECVESRKPPRIDGSLATATALARTYPNPNGKTVDLADDFETMGPKYDQCLRIERLVEKRKLSIQNTVKAAIGENDVGVLPDMSGFGWKMNGKGRRFSRIEKVRIDGQ